MKLLVSTPFAAVIGTLTAWASETVGLLPAAIFGLAAIVLYAVRATLGVRA